MKKIFLFGILTFLIVSCTKNDDVTVVPKKITSVKTETLFYDDITLSSPEYYYNHPFSSKITFEYDNLNRINKVVGGLLLVYGNNIGNQWILADEAQDNIYYENNIIKVECSYNSTYYKPYNKEFTVLNNKIISSSVTYIYPNNTPTAPSLSYTYEYSNNIIKEKKSDGNIYRTFTMTNGNLSKVEEIVYGFNGQLIGKKEYLFSDYDNTENLLKGKFYINGAFYKAFSNNNYRKVINNTYKFDNNQFVLLNSSTINLTFGYDSNNISDLFEYVK